MLVLWFVILKALLANPLPYFSFFGVMVVQIGVKNMHFGAKRKRLNGQSWAPKKAMQMWFVQTHLPKKRNIFFFG
jgi:hypothetical protein